jgi:hypothetical protein
MVIEAHPRCPIVLTPGTLLGDRPQRACFVEFVEDSLYAGSFEFDLGQESETGTCEDH